MRLILERAKLESLTTERLLAYKNRIMGVPEGPDWDLLLPSLGGLNKTDQRWKDCYALVKQVLSKREHCPRV